MSSVQRLQEFISGRLIAAVAEIFSEFENTILRYEEEIDRQRRLLDICWKPEIKLNRVDLRQEWVQKMDLVLTNQQTSVDQEEPGPPELKIVQIEGGWTGPELPQIEDQMETEPELPQIKKEWDDPEPSQLEFPKDPEPSQLEFPKDPEPAELEYLEDPEPSQLEYPKDPEPAELEYLEDPEPSQLEYPKDPEPAELCTNQEEDRLHLNPGSDPVLNDEHEPGTSTAAGRIPDADRLQLLCTICGLNLSSPWKLACHLRRHRIGYSGQTCSKCFTTTKALELHSQTHVGEERTADVQLHQCPTCKKEYTCSSSLATHIRVHSRQKPYSCQICGETFAKGHILGGHMTKHNIKRRKTKRKPDKWRNPCPTCGKMYTSCTGLLIHMRVHSGERPYTRKYHMKSHTKEENCDKREHLCPFCSKVFTNRSTLVIHIRSHTGEKPFSCIVCEEKLISNESLKLHMKSHMDFGCSICEKTFTCNSSLKTHMRIHTGQKPYSCQICEKAFLYKNQLYSHMKVH